MASSFEEKINTLQLLILTIFDLHPLGFAILQILQILIELNIFLIIFIDS